ncbi:hypothetical protein [Kordia sp.]|uniref:hypothetical protein n=1 Tax=Kordia sp. TaxID=1965332 RepID=UPI003D6B205D
MNEEEAKDIIKKFVLENFDDRWSTVPLFFEEFPDFFKFSVNSKMYVASHDFGDSFVGLGASFISKKYREIVQYGSAEFKTKEDFLKTEHKLNVVRTKYKIDRADYFYKVAIQSIIDEEKAFKYIDGVWVYSGGPTFKEMKSQTNFEFSSINYFGLLNLLYFNVIDPFCEILYEKKIIKGHDDKWLRPYFSSNAYDSKDTLFQNYMFTTVTKCYPTFEIDKCYSAHVTETCGVEKLYQYLPIAGFRFYGKDDQTGFVGYLDYCKDKIYQKIRDKELSFEYVEGKDLLFFLFINSKTPFCKIIMERIPDELNKEL